ncbi:MULTISPECIES: Fur family transcriptional regulator [unclassified Bartonella]|uniref:Fur family transcriptional regulator n=2 Tax=Bartonella TaxID=773 RepID=UPI00235FA56E|nr:MULTISPECIES: Fur family transcriptional regulator [unclassified Bartonella]
MNVVLVVQKKNTNIVMVPSFKKTMKKMKKKRNYEKELRAAGLRVTRQRRIILDILAETNDHPNAFEIFQRAHKIDSSISLSTVYRTMKTLEGNGTIHRHSFSGGPSRFEQADGQHHDHLIDVETGQVIEFHSDIIEKLQEEIAKSLGYNIIHHRLELYGKKTTLE